MNLKMFISTITLTLLLCGCAGSGQASVSQAAPAPGAAQTATIPEESASRQAGQSNEALPKTMQLAVGTLKLEGTANAVTGEQATTLLPLWKAARSLSVSQTAASQEVQGLFNQIEKAMTPEQIAAIDAMQISRDNLAATSQGLGLSLGSPQATLDPGVQATMQAARQTAAASGQSLGQGGDGGFGGPPPDGGIGGSGLGGAGTGGSLSDEARATAIAGQPASGVRTGLTVELVDAVIKLLESK